MKLRFSLLLAISAGLIATCAGYYSVFGLSQLFAGASIAVIIMASSLEFGKVVIVSYLQRYWTKTSKLLRFYLCLGVFVLVCITSAGIYGFLSNAYQKTANKLSILETQTSAINSKKDLFLKKIDDNKTIIETKNKRIEQLSTLQSTQENRVDVANTNTNKSRARGDIRATTKEIQTLSNEVNELNNNNTSLMDSISIYTNKKIDLESNSQVASDIGPLKYMSELTGYPMAKIVNFFILLLIFVFDPLAVALVFATNKVIELEKKNKIKDTDDVPLSEDINQIIKSIDENIELPEEEIIFNETPEEPKSTIIPEKTTNRIKLEDIREIKDRGFSVDIPKPANNIITEIGANKHIKNNDNSKFFFKKR